MWSASYHVATDQRLHLIYGVTGWDSVAMGHTLELRAGEVALLGYGSLLSKASLERTLERPYEPAPVMCRLRGWRRTWDSLYPNERFFYLHDGERRYPKNILYLNITRSDTVLNGVLYVIRGDDLAAFDRREAVYDRIEVQDALIDVEVTGGPVWAYVGRPPFLLTAPVPRDEAAIRRSYIDIVERGLAEHDAAFRAEYGGSTDVPPPASIIDDRLE